MNFSTGRIEKMPLPEHPPPPKLCSECLKPCIAMCPGCRAFVHQDYGYSGENCSGRHEDKCEPARLSRERPKKEEIVIVPMKSHQKNGKRAPEKRKAVR
jgi:hypothetical protein